MANRTTSLDSKDLEVTLEVLSSAAHALKLTRFERLSYRALMISINGALVALFAFGYLAIAGSNFPDVWPGKDRFEDALGAAGLVFVVSIVVGIVSLALNVPLFRKAFRERARLKELGLGFLSQSLWKESRRNRWIRRAHGTLIIAIGSLAITLASIPLIPLIGGSVDPIGGNVETTGLAVLFLFCVATAVLMFCAQYLRNQRERMDLTASAEKLRKSLRSLQQRAGEVGPVSVPTELLEQTAKIESAQISKERREAILQSVATRPKGYAIAFGRDAAQQRAALSIADRAELEDLVGQLSTDGDQLESRSGPADGTNGAGATLWSTTKSKRVEIEYVIDQASRSIRVIAVRLGGNSSNTALHGPKHA